MKLSIIVTDTGPLITLAVADSLDVLLLPDLPVIIPDMVRHEVIQDLSKPGAALVAEWIRNNPHKITVAATEMLAPMPN
jgi:predicted nucleic acid-binding protein